MILDFIFFNQNYCHVCKNEYTKNYICEDCLSKLEFVDGDFQTAYGRVYYPLFYNNFIRSVIKRFKFENMTYLVKPLGLILYEYIKDIEVLTQVDFLTYIPMDKKAKFKRGYNQAQLLANELSYYINIPVIEILEKTKTTKEQNKISVMERKSNLSSAYKAKENLNIHHKRVLLIDDLVTTGNTLEKAASCMLSKYDIDLYLLTLTSSRLED